MIRDIYELIEPESRIARERQKQEEKLRPEDDALEPQLGDTAPTFTGTYLDGRPADLAQEAAGAKYILLDFWASWCGPCCREFPCLRRLHARYKYQGLRIIGITLDSDRNAAVKAAGENLLYYPHVFDGQGWRNAVAVLYHVDGIPQTYLLDEDLNILEKGLRGEKLESRLAELLGPGDTAAAAAVEAATTKQTPPVIKVPSAPPFTPPPIVRQPAPSVERDPKASISGNLALYLGVGNVTGPGKVIQVDDHGRVLGTVKLLATPYGLAVDSEGIIAALPRAHKVVRIDRGGQLQTICESQEVPHPMSVAVTPVSRDIVVSDNDTDLIVLLPEANRQHIRKLAKVPGDESHWQDVCVATTSDGYVLFATGEPTGVFRFLPGEEPTWSVPFLPGGNEVVADPTSNRWAASYDGAVRLYEGTKEVAAVPYPVHAMAYPGLLLTFGPDGSLIAALGVPSGRHTRAD